jgi:hypothetical protein
MDEKFRKIKVLIDNSTDEIRKLQLRESYIKMQELFYLLSDYTGFVWKNENNQEKLKQIKNEYLKAINEFYNDFNDWFKYTDLQFKQILESNEDRKEIKYRGYVPELAGGITANWLNK